MFRVKSLLILFLILFPSIVMGADPQPQIYEITDFRGGLNSEASEYTIGENQAVEFVNLRTNRKFGGITKRKTSVLYGTPGSHSIEGLHRYYQTDGDKYLLAAGSTKLYVGDDDLGTFQTIGQSFTDSKRWTFATYKDIAIGTNGYEQPIKYDGKTQITANTDGSRTASDVVAELGAPFAELNTGTALDASSWYQYKVAFYDGTTYSYSTARSNPILTGSGVYDITLTGIPFGPNGTTQRIIYRTVGDASRAAVLADTSYYRVATISDNTTTTYNDSVSDATLLADSAPTWATVSAGTNVTPPKGKYILVHGERAFIAGNVTSKSDIYYSDTFNPDYFDPESFERVRPDDGDEITFVKTVLGILTIGKTNTIQKFYTDGAIDTWSISAPLSFIGCPAPYTASNSPLGLIYLGRSGIYRFNGQYSQLISDAVNPDILDINPSLIGSTVGIYFKNEYLLAYPSSESGGASNNRVLVYEIVRDSYAIDTKTIDSFSTFDSGTDIGVLYYGTSGSDGKIYADEGSGTSLTKRLKSEFDLGSYDDARSIGEEVDPMLEISWDITINGASGTIDSHAYGASAIIDRPDTSGTWTSDIYDLNAKSFTILQWNELLNGAGDVTWAVRSASTSAGVSGASWSSEFTNPSGSDLTGLTANRYVQLRATLSTTDITVTPNIYVNDFYAFRLFYNKTGSSEEANYLSFWASGWRNFGAPGHKKFIRRIKVYYTGTEGTLNFRFFNDEGDVDRNFDIDLSVSPTSSTTDDYEGSNTYKVFTHFPAPNTAADPGPTGEYWRYELSETGTDEWVVKKIETSFLVEEIFD